MSDKEINQAWMRVEEYKTKCTKLESENAELKQLCSEYKDSGKVDKVKWMRLEVEVTRLREALEKMKDQGSRCHICNCWDIAQSALGPEEKK